MKTHSIEISQETFEYLHKEVSGEYVGLNIVDAIVAEHKHLKYENQDPRGKFEQAKNIIKDLAQSVADLSAMMMPMSGITMAVLFAQAQRAGKFIGLEKVESSDMAHQGTVNMVNIIRSPIQKDLEKITADLKKVYKYDGPLFINRDGNQVVVTTFNPSDVAPPEWPEAEYAYADNIILALAILSKKKNWEVDAHQ